MQYHRAGVRTQKAVAQNSLQTTVRFVLIMTMQARLAQYIDEPGGYD